MGEGAELDECGFEVVPGSTAVPGLAGGQSATSTSVVGAVGGEETEGKAPLARAGDDVLEIPILVRVEWEAEVVATAESVATGGGKAARESREIDFWSVLGAGRIIG